MARDLRFAVGHETGDHYAVFVDHDGSNGISSAGYERAARSLEANITGIARLTPSSNPDAEWFMDSPNTGGVRVATAFLISEGLVVGGPGERFTIETRGGLVDVQAASGGMVRVDLGRWKFGQRDAHALEVLLGGSHTVTVLNSVAELELIEVPDGPPVDSFSELVFTAPEQPLVDDGIGRIRVRVFRRGVGEVASSGTGAAAAAIAMRHTSGAVSTHNWRAESAGGSIGVQMFPTEDGEHVSIHGLAAINAIETVEL